MRRALWEMADNEIANLLDRAIMVLDELYARINVCEDLVTVLQAKRDSCKRKSPVWHSYDRQLYGAQRHLGELEARVAAQETLVQSFRNESLSRNPPFWSRYDLDRINRQR